MNIEEIRVEIANAFNGSWKNLIEWIKENSEEKYAGFYIPGVDEQNAASILVDMAYEAGKAEIPECLECKSGDYEKGFNKAAKDPKAWYAKGKNGEHFHFWDKFRHGSVEEVIDRFDMLDDGTLCINGHYAHYCEKVIPDTREKIKEEMANNFFFTMIDNTEERLDLAEQFISRIEALEVD